jgi:DNA-binding MarR family transcriptional regulator
MVAMNEPRWLNPQERRAWLGLLAITTLLPGTLDGTVQREAGITLFDYTVLAMLSESEDRMLAMSELAARSNASLSRLSHVAKKLEGRGWVARSQCPTDARVTTAAITDEGMRTVERLAPLHVESVRQAVFDGLEDDDVADLERVARRIVARLDENHWIFRDGVEATPEPGLDESGSGPKIERR